MISLSWEDKSGIHIRGITEQTREGGKKPLSLSQNVRPEGELANTLSFYALRLCGHVSVTHQPI